MLWAGTAVEASENHTPNPMISITRLQGHWPADGLFISSFCPINSRPPHNVGMTRFHRDCGPLDVLTEEQFCFWSCLAALFYFHVTSTSPYLTEPKCWIRNWDQMGAAYRLAFSGLFSFFPCVYRGSLPRQDTSRGGLCCFESTSN